MRSPHEKKGNLESVNRMHPKRVEGHSSWPQLKHAGLGLFSEVATMVMQRKDSKIASTMKNLQKMVTRLESRSKKTNAVMPIIKSKKSVGRFEGEQ